jgi:hypothetical protein
MTEDEAAWVRNYAEEVSDTFRATFQADDRFPDWPRLAQRFSGAVNSVLKYGFSKFSAVEEAHNEMCVVRALLANENPRLGRLDYEPPLEGCARSIDFRGTGEDGLTLFVDVKTTQPKSSDRWDQFEKANEERWFPANVNVMLSKAWLGGDLWHSMFAARSRMLEYALELEKKITEGNLLNRENTFFILVLCGAGYHWHEDELEDFVAFYRTGVHRPDDPFSKAELKHIEKKRISLTRTITRFACMRRTQGGVLPAKLNWHVRPPQ